jgi:enediyne biosynthesis protein E4
LATKDGKGNRGFTLANFGDVDNAGDVDAVLCNANEITPGSPQPVDACGAMLNDGKGHFTLAPSSDRDGVLDFWPSTVAHWPYQPTDPSTPSTPFRGNGDGTFSNVSGSVGLPTRDGTVPAATQWRHVFGNTACDIDGDGDDDMIFASYGREENQVWRNDNGTFVEVGHQLGIDHDDRVDVSDDQSFRCFCAANPTDQTCTPMPPAPTVQKCADAFGVGSGPYFRGWQPGVSDQPWSLV